MIAPSCENAIAYVRLPQLIRDAARDFQQLTGLTVVTTLGLPSPNGRTRRLPSPAVHPLCAKVLKEIRHEGPCEAEWRKHVRHAVRASGPWIHTCPLGSRCAGVPIVLGDELLGLAKLVTDQETSKKRFLSAAHLLEALMARPCQDLRVRALSKEIETLKELVGRLRLAKQPSLMDNGGAPLPSSGHENNDRSVTNDALIDKVLDYLNEHYGDPHLSRRRVADAVRRLP